MSTKRKGPSTDADPPAETKAPEPSEPSPADASSVTTSSEPDTTPSKRQKSDPSVDLSKMQHPLSTSHTPSVLSAASTPTSAAISASTSLNPDSASHIEASNSAESIKLTSAYAEVSYDSDDGDASGLDGKREQDHKSSSSTDNAGAVHTSSSVSKTSQIGPSPLSSPAPSPLSSSPDGSAGLAASSSSGFGSGELSGQGELDEATKAELMRVHVAAYKRGEVPLSLSPDPPTRVVHFRRVGDNVGQGDILALVSPFGTLSKIVMMRGKNQALAEFDSLSAAIQFVNHYVVTKQDPMIKGRKVYMRFSRHDQLNASQPSNGQTLMAVLHSEADPKSLGITITADFIYSLFSVYGSVQKVVILAHSAGLQALIQFASAKDCAVAFTQMNKKTISVGGDPRMEISIYLQHSHRSDLLVKQQTVRTRDYTTQPFKSNAFQPKAPVNRGFPGAYFNQSALAAQVPFNAMSAAYGVPSSLGMPSFPDPFGRGGPRDQPKGPEARGPGPAMPIYGYSAPLMQSGMPLASMQPVHAIMFPNDMVDPSAYASMSMNMMQGYPPNAAFDDGSYRGGPYPPPQPQQPGRR